MPVIKYPFLPMFITTCKMINFTYTCSNVRQVFTVDIIQICK